MSSGIWHIKIAAIAISALIGAAALLGLASCGESQTSAELERLSLLTEENPDSALSLLLAVDTASFADRADRARFAVALTNARYLAYDPECNDSLLRLNATYFSDAPADRFKMLYLYLSATFKIERKLFTKAIIELFDAAQIAEASSDHLYAGRIYRAISDIYTKCFDSKQYLKYSYLSLIEFQKCAKPSFANWQLIRIAEAYHNIKDYSKSLIVCKLTHSKAISEQDKDLEDISKRIAARDYMELKQYVEAINELRGLDYYEPEDFYTLSYSYLSLNEIDSAIFYKNKLLERQPFNKELTFRIAKKTGDIKTMAVELDSEFHRQSDFTAVALNYNIAGTESDYFKKLNLKKQLEQKKTYIIIGCSTIFIILLLFCMYLYHIRSINRKKSQIKRYIDNTALLKSELENSAIENEQLLLKLNNTKEEIENERLAAAMRLEQLQNKHSDMRIRSTLEITSLNDHIEHLKLQLQELDKKYNCVKHDLESVQSNGNAEISKILRNVIVQRFSLLNEICSVLYQGTDNITDKSKGLREQKTIKRITNIINEIKVSENVIAELEDIVDRSYNGIISKFKEEMPELYKTSRNLYLYKCLSLPVLTIAYLLGTNERGVYDRTYQLKHKITIKSPNNFEELIKPLKH